MPALNFKRLKDKEILAEVLERTEAYTKGGTYFYHVHFSTRKTIEIYSLLSILIATTSLLTLRIFPRKYS